MVLLLLLSNRPSLAIGALAIGLHNSGVMGRLLLEGLRGALAALQGSRDCVHANQGFYTFRLGYFSDLITIAIESDHSRPFADITVVSISHLARTVDNATHYRNVETGEVTGGVSDLMEDLLKIKQSATAARTGHVFDHRFADSKRLQDREAHRNFLFRGFC